MSKRARQASQAQRKLEEMRRQQRSRQRLQRLLLGAAAAVVIAVVAIVIVVVVANRPSSTAHAANPASGATVDGIQCQTNEQVAYHIHVHLAIFVNGVQQTVPRGIGIPGPQTVQNGFVASGKCFYWLHTHDSTGVIHIESPTQRQYTLGQFFDIWGHKLSGDQVGSAKGQLTVFVDGKKVTGDPRSITFSEHKLIQLDVGSVVPPKPYTFARGL